jgi:hypothetical protein
LDLGWRDVETVTLEAERYGVEAPARGWASLPWHERFVVFRRSWCKAHGFLNPTHKMIDHKRARAAGIDTRGTSRWRLTRRGVQR